MNGSRQIVLVTGTPRSSTTAVGKVLALAGKTCALHEPFNGETGLVAIDGYFVVPGTEAFSLGRLDDTVRQIGQLRMRLKRGVFKEDSWLKRIGKVFYGGRTRRSYLLCKLSSLTLRTIVWKDPFAVFCVKQLLDRGVKVVGTVRDPCAVAASFKRMGWTFDLDRVVAELRSADLPDLRQAAALHSYGAPGAGVNGNVRTAVVLWELCNGLLSRWAGESDGLRLVNVDTLLADPLGVYRRLYDWLDLTWDDRVQRKITARYPPDDGRPLRPREGVAHDWHRNPRTVNSYWQQYLSPQEIAYVRSATCELWQVLQRHQG